MPKASKAKKLILVPAIFASVTPASKEAPKVILDQVPCIHYPVQLCKDRKTIQVLINSGNEVNAMTSIYAKKLGLRTQKTDVGVQTIDGSSLNMFRMIITGF